jgi:hypothetical protein
VRFAKDQYWGKCELVSRNIRREWVVGRAR